MTEDSTKYYSITSQQTLSSLKATDKGLSSHEAEQRLSKYGLNELTVEEGISPFKIFIEQFASPLVWILVAALAISLFLHEYVDATVIGLIIVINAILGFFQEYKAEKAIEALKRLASLKATVLRNGKASKIDSKYLVPGDIILLETGEKVPADARLLEIHSLQTQEGPLTGESLPVTKQITDYPEKTALADRKNMVYSSTIITKGRGKAIITRTGMQTQVGKIATLIQESHEKLTPLQKKLRDLGKYLTIAVVAVAIVVFFAGLLSGKSASVMFLTAIALAVAAIPEGLPAVITIALALGVQKMIKRHVLVRKLASVETLGSVSVICTDKTGTLTHNQMTVTKIFANNQVYDVTGSGYEPQGTFLIGNKLAKPEPLHTLLKIGALCNDAKLEVAKNKISVVGDPTEAALIVAAQKAGIEPEKLLKKTPRQDEIPFTSERKMMTTIHSDLSYTKGSPAIIIERCNRILIAGKVTRLDRAAKKQLLDQNTKFASQALRVLAFAYSKDKDEKNLIFVGLQAMIDPPREEVKQAIATCHKAGIRVIMITGDQIATAKAIAAELGIKGDALTGQDMGKVKLATAIKKVGIFARVNPEHKLDIVKVLKAQNHVVAMTGDGVNDAPALKKADIGVSMGITGTDVAKEASDMILTDDNFTSIVSAVEEGRGIFENIRKFVNYLLSSNLGEVTAILLASLFGMPLPLTAIQILWVNLVTDGLPATALSLDPHSKGIMALGPRPSRESILSKELRREIIFFGVLIGIGTVILFWLYRNSPLAKAQTVAFTALVIFEVARLHMIRSKYKLSLFSNKWLLGAVLLSLLLHLLTIYTPLSRVFKTSPLDLIDWGVIFLGAFILLIINRILLIIQEKRSNKKKS
jgi:P-type Ca2+ transporter type 2C